MGREDQGGEGGSQTLGTHEAEYSHLDVRGLNDREKIKVIKS